MDKRLSLLLGVLLAVIVLLLITQMIKKPSAERLQIGQSSEHTWIDFELSTTSGATWSSTSIKNQAVVLNFWAPWCLPCRIEVPYLIELHTRYAPDFKFIGIAIDKPGAVRQFEDEVGLNYLSLVDDSAGMELLRRYEDSGALPLTLIFDQEGHVRHRFVGSFRMKELEQTLKDMQKISM